MLNRRRPARSVFGASVVVLAGMLLAPRVGAGGGVALAESLFQRGRELMDAGQIEQACEKFSESQRLDPGLGTLLNLASCNEKLGKVATAWGQFREALALAAQSGATERADLARTRAAALESRLPKLAVVVPNDANVPGLEVRLDGVALGRAAWGFAAPVDPGIRAVRAVAPGYRTWEKRVKLQEGSSLRVVVPALARADSGAQPVRETPVQPTQRLIGWTALGIGAASVGVGSYYGIRALSRNDESQSLCPTSSTCTDRGAALSHDAYNDAKIANWTLGAGLVLSGAGAVLLWTAPQSEATSTQARGGWMVIPTNEGAAASWQGVW